MNKGTLVALVVLVVLAAAIVYYAGRKKEHSVIFKTPSGKTATLTVE